MRRVIQGALIVAGLIHFLPVTGVIGAERLTRMYAMPFTDPNLLILMRHRAVMLGLLGGFVLYGAFRPAMQVPAIALGAVSLASIVGLAWSTGGYNQALSQGRPGGQHRRALLPAGRRALHGWTSRKVDGSGTLFCRIEKVTPSLISRVRGLARRVDEEAHESRALWKLVTSPYAASFRRQK